MELDNYMVPKYLKEIGSEEKNLHLTLKDTMVYGYLEETVMRNKCRALLDMRYIRDSGSMDLFYETGGARSLTRSLSQAKASARSMTDLLYSTVKSADCALSFLIRASELAIREDMIFLAEDGSIKLVYIPHKDNAGDEATLGMRLAIVFDQLSMRAELSEGDRDYFSELCRSIARMDENTGEMLKTLEEAIRQFSLRGSGSAAPVSEGASMPELRDYRDKADQQSLMYVRETQKAYNANGGIKNKFKNMISELVS